MSNKIKRVVSPNRARVRVIQKLGIASWEIASKGKHAVRRMLKQGKEWKWRDEVFFFVMKLAGVLVAFVEAYSCTRAA
jgi:hypothetical protein